jgi:hypothetical protein
VTFRDTGPGHREWPRSAPLVSRHAPPEPRGWLAPT